MAGRLTGKKCFLTAAGQGIGRAAALAYAAEGATVVATDRDAGKLAELAAQGITTLALDVLDDAAVQAAIAAHGPFDVLFNCAGFVHQNTAETCTDADWDFAFALNVRAQWKVMQAVIPGMLAQGGGAIVNMASAAGSVKGVANRFVYGATKAAVVGMTKSVAADYVARGIRCNCVCPGTVDTPSLGERIEANAAAAGSVEAARAAFVARQAMGRLATAEEIAALVIYLSAPESAFVTAQAIVIDGGWTN
ncbi:SDR family oxidoreductase [Pseudoroseomonas cervicalis]|uniref:Oxidoreductase, short chain dehydrogenase/reductase family protein n=1 Tax=Pseudoroseomonas cervicalis ATCC 49957 TaxID=525371 RepID=D5RSE9_9PROT|nr:SDR family oxidoreductase [Pseudoroseomonas cervicalis]EFH09772.1 oxidoreductase, short chain dehydrogenase/reductase family protein [Pseudoroseomonas cervicalis ATCC 49957]